MRLHHVVLSVLTAALLAACGGQSGTTSGPTNATSPTTSPPAAAQTTPATSAPAASAPQVPAPGATTIDVTVSGGKVSPPRQLVDVPLGSPVELVVTSDVADEVHVHGYDEMADVTPGNPARVSFAASIPGVFEVELETAKLRLLQLRVQ
jgi:hypothetical protein